MKQSPFSKAQALLGRGVLFIPIARGSKKPPRDFKWGHLTAAEMKEAEHIRQLQEAAAVAAVLGPVSDNHVAIDFDTDQAEKNFFVLNPALQSTLRTHGKRGCVIWLRMKGDYPACRMKFTDATKQALGEWRAGGNCYSIIAGVHKDGGSYTVLVDAPPAVCTFADIHWPAHWQNTPTFADIEQETEKPKSKGTHAMQSSIQKNGDDLYGVLHDSLHGDSAWPSAWHSPKGRVYQLTEGTNTDSPLETLYKRFIQKHWIPAPSQRNTFIVESIPFLYQAVAEPAVMPLVMRYHKLNAHLFNDTEKDHQHQASAHLEAVKGRYLKSLNETELAKYSCLRTERERAGFRICRALSLCKSDKIDCEGSQFVLSCPDLGCRILAECKAAHRLLSKLERFGIVRLVRKGLQRRPGTKQTPGTVWDYCL